MDNLISAPTAVNPTMIHADEFCELHAPLRFPISREEWDRVLVMPERPRANIVGNHSFDLVVNRKARKHITGTMRQLFGRFREDFDRASEFFQPTQWRLLYYLDQYPLTALSSPSFDVVSAFREIYQLKQPHADVPNEWTGSAEPSADMLWDMMAYRYEPDPDVAKAAWSILAFAHSLGLEKNEVLHVPWWRVWWIDRCLAAYR